jgi:hypothetical protein
MKKEWTIESAKRCIERNKGKIKDKKITIAKLGIKVLGAIDFLINYHNYIKTGE